MGNNNDMYEVDKLYEKLQATPLMRSVNDITRLKKILENKVDVNECDVNGNTALTYAALHCINDVHHVISLLLRHGADINRRNFEGRTALLQSVMYNKMAGAKILLQHGACVHMADNEGATPLIKAAYTDDVAYIDLLLTYGANINSQNNMGKTALMYAAKYNNTKVVAYLLRYGADTELSDWNHATALIQAVHNEQITSLLIKSNANVNHQNKYGITALMEAARSGSSAVALLLLEKNANVYLQDISGKTALMYSLEHEFSIFAHLMLQDDFRITGIIACHFCIEDMQKLHSLLRENRSISGKNTARLPV